MTVPVTVNLLDPNTSLQGLTRGLGGIARSGPITYDVDYGEYARWIYVGATGNIAYLRWDGTVGDMPSAASGVWHPVLSIRIISAGTTVAANQIRWGS